MRLLSRFLLSEVCSRLRSAAIDPCPAVPIRSEKQAIGLRPSSSILSVGHQPSSSLRGSSSLVSWWQHAHPFESPFASSDGLSSSPGRVSHSIGGAWDYAKYQQRVEGDRWGLISGLAWRMLSILSWHSSCFGSHCLWDFSWQRTGLSRVS